MYKRQGYSSVDEYLENSESSKQSMIKQILIMQALAEKNNICLLYTSRVILGQYRIILSADPASEVRQMPSQKRS